MVECIVHSISKLPISDPDGIDCGIESTRYADSG